MITITDAMRYHYLYDANLDKHDANLDKNDDNLNMRDENLDMHDDRPLSIR